MFESVFRTKDVLKVLGISVGTWKQWQADNYPVAPQKPGSGPKPSEFSGYELLHIALFKRFMDLGIRKEHTAFLLGKNPVNSPVDWSGIAMGGEPEIFVVKLKKGYSKTIQTSDLPIRMDHGFFDEHDSIVPGSGDDFIIAINLKDLIADVKAKVNQHTFED